jgi:hypothetical protein
VTNEQIISALNSIDATDRAAIERIIMCCLDSVKLLGVRAALEATSDDEERESSLVDSTRPADEPIRLGASPGAGDLSPSGRPRIYCSRCHKTQARRVGGLCLRCSTLVAELERGAK